MVEEILKSKHSVIEKLRRRRSLKGAILEARNRGERAIIAEVKRRGLKEREEQGLLIEAEEAAKKMEKGGACGISVLTDESFSGDLEDLKRVKLSVDLPVLRKDFIFDDFQVYESYAHGADAILLIARFLSDKKLEELAMKAFSLGMETLIEVDKDSKERLFNSNIFGISPLIGINNRDLATLDVNLETFEEITSEIKLPNGVFLVAMSGIIGKEDASRMFKAGADALLIGTSIMNAEKGDIESKVREFVLCI